MNPSTKRVLFFILTGVLLLAACAPAPATPDPAEIQDEIDAAVEMTVAAQNAETQQALALTPVLTNTPLPTQTEIGAPTPTPLIPTATPFVVVPPTVAPSGSSGGSGSAAPVKAEYACDVISRRPYDNTYFKPNDTFDIKWTIVNTGTKEWRAGLDLKYNNGVQMTAPGAFVELPAMKPGDEYEMVLDATAPKDDGTQVMVWMVEGGFCFPYTSIIVEK